MKNSVATNDIKIIKQETKGQGERQFTVSSVPNARRSYIVSLNGETWVCSCPVWVSYRLACRHIFRVQKELA